MIAVDTNILVYAHRRDSAFHVKAAEFIRRYAEGSEPWAVPFSCLYEFLAMVTHPKIYRPASTPAQAAAQIDAWAQSPSLVWIGELPDHWPKARDVFLASRLAGAAAHDARIAVICIEHGVRVLYTADRDFGRIAGLTVRNPLAGR